MATEQEKTGNRARMWGLTVAGMTMGIWDMVEESAVSLSPGIGEQILKMAEKQLGLEIAGESPRHILIELGRIFVDEYGFCSEALVEGEEPSLKVTLKNAVGVPEYVGLRAQGLEKPFSHPFYCTGLAALARLGKRARGNVEMDLASKTAVITYDILN
ncbi:MAG TPA: hypothetical protein VHO48_16380 [Anaerolineaceae bacterium]|nr:hypothetical protein [Anaerolineaceae bacterium]